MLGSGVWMDGRRAFGFRFIVGGRGEGGRFVSHLAGVRLLRRMYDFLGMGRFGVGTWGFGGFGVCGVWYGSGRRGWGAGRWLWSGFDMML